MFLRHALLVGLALSLVAGVHAAEPNALSPDEKSAGFELLFTGTDLAGWKPGGNCKTADGAIPREGKGGPRGPPEERLFEEFYKGTDGRPVSTTMALVRILSKLLRDKRLGRYIVPIVPDEARTFGLESLFREIGIYAHTGQLYEPVDSASLLYYKEAKDGQILEEGITEAGSMASFIAAGNAYATHGVNTIPLFIFYSMFGMQRVGDLVWAARDNVALVQYADNYFPLRMLRMR